MPPFMRMRTSSGQPATLCFGLIKDHPWAGGNKRTAVAITAESLRLNRYKFPASNAGTLEPVPAVEADQWKVMRRGAGRAGTRLRRDLNLKAARVSLPHSRAAIPAFAPEGSKAQFRGPSRIAGPPWGEALRLTLLLLP